MDSFELTGSFLALKELVEKLESPEDVKSSLPDFLFLSSDVSKYFIDVSKDQDTALTNLKFAVKSGEKAQREIEESIYRCQLLADQIHDYPIQSFDSTDLNLLSLEDYAAKKGTTVEELEKMDPYELISQRLNDEIERAQIIKNEYNELCAKKQILTDKLNKVKRKFAKIIPRIKEIKENCDPFISILEESDDEEY